MTATLRLQEHQSALQRWQAKEQERQAAMAELAAFAQYRLKVPANAVAASELCHLAASAQMRLKLNT